MIAPSSILWQACYKCPYCDWPTFLDENQLKNPSLKDVFCGCGRSYKIERPRLQFLTSDSDTVISKNNIDTSFIKDAKDLMKSQGYSSEEIKTAMEISCKNNITNIQDLFKKVIPQI